MPIHERLAIVATRKRFGDREGDTIYESKTKHCVLTQVKRKSRYLLANRIAD